MKVLENKLSYLTLNHPSMDMKIEITDTEKIDGYRYKLDTLRGNIRYRDETIKRMLIEAFECCQLETPFMSLIIERIEETLKIIDKNLE